MTRETLSAETNALLFYLRDQRDHALRILEGLDEEILRRPILPSGWNCLGMIQHLAVDTERLWFRAVVAGEQTVIDGLANSSAWDVDPSTPASELFEVYRQEIKLADAIIADTPLDAAPVWWPPDVFGEWRLHTVREIMLHVLAETARHTGHLDAARELIDGKLWLVQN
jgi:hypothetical protein